MRTLNIFRGDTMVVPFAITSSVGLPVSIVGSAFWFTVKSDPAQADSLAAFQGTTSNGGVQITDAANGRGQIVMMPAETAALTPGTRYYWDLQQQDAAGNVTTHEAGVLIVKRDQTRTPNP